MKIAIVVFQFPVISHSFILNLIAGLIDLGHDVHIHAIESKSPSDAAMHAIVSNYQLIAKTRYPSSASGGKLSRTLNLIRQILGNLNRGSLACLAVLDIRQPKYSLVLLRKALSLLHRPQYDIIHAQFGYEGIASLKFWQLGLLQGKLITTFRGHDITGFLQHGARLNPYQSLFKYGNYFLTNSHFFRQRVIELGCPADKVQVLYSGVDCQKFKYRVPVFKPGQSIQVVTIGRLVEKKGIAYCIQAVAKLIQQGRKLRYLIIGDGPLKADLTELIQTLGMEDVILLMGAKPQCEILEILKSSHLFVAASTTAADGDQDGPVNTLKEAMAVGLPVIGTDHGGIPELIESEVSGFLVPEKDVDAIAAQLDYLMAQPERWPILSQQARQKVEHNFAMEQVNRQLADIYRLRLTASPLSMAKTMDGSYSNLASMLK
ncbi:MAG: glycosyltransferase [Cyanobacteria bacterium P01_A01_bin.123]